MPPPLAACMGTPAGFCVVLGFGHAYVQICRIFSCSSIGLGRMGGIGRAICSRPKENKGGEVGILCNKTIQVHFTSTSYYSSQWIPPGFVILVPASGPSTLGQGLKPRLLQTDKRNTAGVKKRTGGDRGEGEARGERTTGTVHCKIREDRRIHSSEARLGKELCGVEGMGKKKRRTKGKRGRQQGGPQLGVCVAPPSRNNLFRGCAGCNLEHTFTTHPYK